MLRENGEYFNWRPLTGREGEVPLSDKERREKEKAAAAEKAEEERRRRLDIQKGEVSKEAGELLDAVND